MIEGVMSIMEGDEGMDRQKYKGEPKNWDTEKLGGGQKN